MFKNSFFTLFTFVLLTACASPLYESDFTLYRQYKYWETAGMNWVRAGDFDFLVETFLSGASKTLKLTPHRNGVPDFSGAYQSTAKNIAFKVMNASCGQNNYDLSRARPQFNGRVLDRFFYQNSDLSIGVSFMCRTNPSSRSDDVSAAEDEAMKWQPATRERRYVNDIETYIDTLPTTPQGLRQMRIRMFGATPESNLRLARELMIKTCGSPLFTLVYRRPTTEYIKQTGRAVQKISDSNVYAYGFYCR